MELILLLIATAPSVQTQFLDSLYYPCAHKLEFKPTCTLNAVFYLVVVAEWFLGPNIIQIFAPLIAFLFPHPFRLHNNFKACHKQCQETAFSLSPRFFPQHLK